MGSGRAGRGEGGRVGGSEPGREARRLGGEGSCRARGCPSERRLRLRLSSQPGPTWSMKVLMGAVARCPNVRVSAPHHCGPGTGGVGREQRGAVSGGGEELLLPLWRRAPASSSLMCLFTSSPA